MSCRAGRAFGRYSAAIGAGEPAAYASGVKVNRQKVIAFVLSGGFAALAGVVLAGRLASGSPTLAAELLLPSIAAVVVGGTAITGGVGSIWRTLVGALIISVVRIGMTFLGVNIFAQNIVFGVVLDRRGRHNHRPIEDPDRQIVWRHSWTCICAARSP